MQVLSCVMVVLPPSSWFMCVYDMFGPYMRRVINTDHELGGKDITPK
jgi:hypothetical protein